MARRGGDGCGRGAHPHEGGPGPPVAAVLQVQAPRPRRPHQQARESLETRRGADPRCL